MATVTLLDGDVRSFDAAVADGRVLVEPDRLPQVIGWELKPEGLCRDDVCVPVPDRDRFAVGDRVDLGGVAAALGRPSVVDPSAAVMAIALPAEARRTALDALVAPPFTLHDLDGALHELAEWRGRKKLLVAFASW
jgi:hypothetical protein